MLGRGVCICVRGTKARMAGEMAAAAGGSHPTGMHSCCNTDEIKKKV